MNAELAALLLDIQKNIPDIQKNAINPHFKNSYVTLDALLDKVLPILHERGVVLVQAPTTVGDGVPGLRTVLLHTSGEALVDETMPLTLDKVTPQGQGSAITYARRYALMSILSLVADEDDDGNKGSTARRTRNVAKKPDSNVTTTESGEPIVEDRSGGDGSYF